MTTHKPLTVNEEKDYGQLRVFFSGGSTLRNGAEIVICKKCWRKAGK